MGNTFFTPAWRWQDHTQTELMLLQAYVSNVEAQLDQGLISFAKTHVVVFEEGTPDEQQRVFLDGIDMDDWDVESIYNEVLPRFHRSAALLTLCAWFEDRLANLCHAYQTETGSRLSLKDLKDSGVKGSRTYLCKVIGLELSGPNNERTWQDVLSVYRVRNAVAHLGGTLTSLNERERQVVQTTLALDPQSLELTDRSLSLALNVLRRYALQIASVARDYDKAQRALSKEHL